MAFQFKKKIEGWMRSDETGAAAHAFLYTLSLFYGAGVRLRLNLYRAGVIKPKRVPCRVVSVGNITAGGTGKTPVTIHIAGRLKAEGKRVVIVSRGYKGASPGPAAVSDGKTVLLGPEEAGDEPYLMAMRLKGVPVVVGAGRVEASLFAIEKFSPDFIILDDGFQHIRLGRDMNILLVDAVEGFGNGHLLPRGVLREPLAGIKRADIVMIKGGCLESGSQGRLAGLPAFSFRYRPATLYSLMDNAEKGLPYARGKKAVALSGLARPESFLRTLEELGLEVIKSIAFPDHHAYSRADIETIKKESKGADIIITTEKDGVKLKALGTDMPVFILGIDAVIEDEEGFKKMLLGAGVDVP